MRSGMYRVKHRFSLKRTERERLGMGKYNLQRILYVFSSLNDLGRVITSNGSVDDITKSALYLILGTISSSEGAVFHYEPSSCAMENVVRKGLDGTTPLSFTLSDGDLNELLLASQVFETGSGQEPLQGFTPLQREVRTLGDGMVGISNIRPSEKLDHAERGVTGFTFRHREHLKAVKAALAAPLRVGDKLVGLLTVGKRFSGGEYGGEDREILSMMSQQLSVVMYNQQLFSRLQRKVEENRKLYENLKQIYHDTIQAFAVAIDAKDDYTQGHSARVAQYAMAIGQELGLPGDELEGLRFAGLLHDIGKITVDSSIIRKKSSLNEQEIMQIHRHPSVGYDILSHIKFPWGDLSKLALHHHEKVDGHGYPDGIEGKDLVLGVRIITLADSFDAMTSDRPYRKQISLGETIEEIRRCMGTHFDVEVCRALFRVLEKELTGEIADPKVIPCLNRLFDTPYVLQVLKAADGPCEAARHPV